MIRRIAVDLHGESGAREEAVLVEELDRETGVAKKGHIVFRVVPRVLSRDPKCLSLSVFESPTSCVSAGVSSNGRSVMRSPLERVLAATNPPHKTLTAAKQWETETEEHRTPFAS